MRDAADTDTGLDEDMLASKERVVRNEARTVPLRVGAELAAVRSAARPCDALDTQPRGRNSQEADLGLGIGITSPRQGRYCYPTGLQSGIIEARGDARWRGLRRGGGGQAGKPHTEGQNRPQDESPQRGHGFRAA